MWKREFDSGYVGFTKDGAQWLRDNTDIKLVGEINIRSVGYWVRFNINAFGMLFFYKKNYLSLHLMSKSITNGYDFYGNFVHVNM